MTAQDYVNILQKYYPLYESDPDKLLSYVNEARERVALSTMCLLTKEDIQTLPTIQTYSYSTPFMNILEVYLTYQNVRFNLQRVMYCDYPIEYVGFPTAFSLLTGKIVLYPTPDSNTYTITIVGARRPTDLTSLNQTDNEIPVQYGELVGIAAAQNAAIFESNVNVYQFLEQLYNARLIRAKRNI